jgi:hypothetical protein
VASRLRAQPRVAQAPLDALKLAFERLRARVGTEAPSVQLGSQQRDPVVVVVGLGLQLLDRFGRACASNSSTE